MSENGVPPEGQNGNLGLCPYLKVYYDPSLRFSFANEDNYCHRVRHPQPISLHYQETMCLTTNYESCAVYIQGLQGDLPKGIQNEIATPPRQWRKQIAYILIPILVLGLMLVILLVNYNSRISQNTGLSQASKTQNAVLIQETFSAPTVAQTVEPSLAPTFTESPSPTETATPPPPASPPDLETPFGLQNHYLIHIALDGESVPILAKKYKTSSQVISLLNIYGDRTAIWAGMPIVIMPGRIDPKGVQPMVAIHITQEISLEDLAKQNHITADDIRRENNLGPDELIEAGRWLVIPVR
jgi:hypothetical protein